MPMLACTLLTGCYKLERDCQKFRTGTFEFETLLNGTLQKTRFTRNDTLEIDFFQNRQDSSRVRWINDCEFIVKKIRPKNRAEEKLIHMKILTTHKDSYTFEYSLVGKTKKQRGTAKKIN